MWRQRAEFLKRALVVVDVAISAGAFLGALYLRDFLDRVQAEDGVVARALVRAMTWLGGLPPRINPEDYQWLLLGLLPVWALTFAYYRTGDFRLSYRNVVRRYLRASVVGLGLFILVAFLFKLQFVARTFVAMFGLVQLTALLLSRAVIIEFGAFIRRRRFDGHRVAIVGAGEEAVEFARSLLKNSPVTVKLLGYVTVPGAPAIREARPHLGYVGSLAELLDRLPVDEVVFAVPGKHPELFADAIAACDERGVDVLLTLPPQYPENARMEVANVSGFDFPLLGLRRTPSGELRLAVKRLIDIVGGLVGLAVAAPVLLATALAIKLETPGPVFFRQVRAGRNGRKFVMYKFRSMLRDADAKRAPVAFPDDGAAIKIRRDPRITRVGRFIRRNSIDEIPQLFNILMGDMSLVGPRPPLPSEVEEYEPWQRRRLSVKPGLTGLWQVCGRSQIEFDEWMQLDLEYIDNWSLWLDLKILLKTLPAVLFHRRP